MFVWIGIVACVLITSSFTSGLFSAMLDFAAFLIILCLGVRRLKESTAQENEEATQSNPVVDDTEFNEELKQINTNSQRIDITP